MRKSAILAVALLSRFSVPATAAAPGTAQNFLDRANGLKEKGPLALFDKDYKRLKAEATAAGKSIGADRVAAEKAGRPILYCQTQAQGRYSVRTSSSMGWREFRRTSDRA